MQKYLVSSSSEETSAVSGGTTEDIHFNHSSSALPSATRELRNPFYPIRTNVASKYRASSHRGHSRTLDMRVTCKWQAGRKLLVRIQNSRKTGGPEVSNSFLILPHSTPSHPGSQSRGPLGGAAAVPTASGAQMQRCGPQLTEVKSAGKSQSWR